MSFTATVWDRFQDSYPPIGPDALLKLEKHLGIRLPEDYLRFLLERNGGHFKHEVAIPSFERGNDEEHTLFYVRSLYGLVFDREDIHSDIRGAFNDAYDWPHISSEWLPIGEWMSFTIFLAVGEIDRGQVWYVNDVQTSDRCLIASSFDDFINRLVPIDDLRLRTETVSVFKAIEEGDLGAVQAFVQAGKRIDYRDARGRTLLMAAAMHRWPKIVKWLLDCGADAKARDDAGNTPLHYGSRYGSFDSVNALVDARADLNAENTAGISVLQNAKQGLAWRVARQLVKCGAKGDWREE
jgi:hypothetical protein